MEMHYDLPLRLQRFIVDQNYSRYTPIDQAVWRYILRQLKAHLTTYGHEAYEEGLKKTGLSTEEIPRIEKISQALENFGWKAIPVSGFIPPAIFMEMQSLGYLPIASDMRSIDHIHYTPAPDIVHEAAGHAPIIADPEYAQYLKNYAHVSKKAIISHEDLAQYEAIRILSDLKEAPDSTSNQIKNAEDKLNSISENMSHTSEAALLSRMNWWTAEYGLIGEVKAPKIFGAGLLSSIGESRSCLDEKVTKLPLSIDCLNYSYDITEPQPQLFVTPDFKNLTKVLNELKQNMAFTQGGISGLEKIRMAKSINTVELNTGLQISGKLVDFFTNTNNNHKQPIYFRMEGPTQICYQNQELKGHDVQYHSHGYSTPIGLLEGLNKCLSQTSKEERKTLGLIINKDISFSFLSGIRVHGKLKETLEKNDQLVMLSFEDCTVTFQEQVLFAPEWGVFDMAVGKAIPSVYGGPADYDAYTKSDELTEEFVAKVIPQRVYNENENHKHSIYQTIRQIRNQNNMNICKETLLKTTFNDLRAHFPKEWLAYLEIYELALDMNISSPWFNEVEKTLEVISIENSRYTTLIKDGLKIVKLQET